MKLKKLISLTTALLMTATVAAGIAAPATADVSFSGHTVALLDDTGSKSYLELPGDSSGNLAADTTITLGIYIFNDPGTQALDIPITFEDIPEQYIVDISVTDADVNKGQAYGNQKNINGTAFAGVYNNGADALDPNFKEGGGPTKREGVKVSVAPIGIMEALNPSLDDTQRGYDNNGDWVVPSKADTYLEQFSFTLAAGTPKGSYAIKFDDSLNKAFMSARNPAMNDILGSISFSNFNLYVGESAPVPMTVPVFDVDDTNSPYTVDDADRARKYFDANGVEMTKVIKNNDQEIDFSNGFKIVTVPVRVTNGISAVGLGGLVKITGPDADKVMLDSAPRYALNPAGKYANAAKPITAGPEIAFGGSTGAGSKTVATDQYTWVIAYENYQSNNPISDGEVIFNLNFLVALTGEADRTYDFSVELSDVEWSVDVGGSLVTASIDPITGVRLADDSGNTMFSNTSDIGNIVVVDGNPVVTTTTTTPAPGVTTTTTLAPGVTTTRRTGGGGGNATTDNPDTGDSGVVGVIATIAILGLAGGAAYFAKKKNDEE